MAALILFEEEESVRGEACRFAESYLYQRNITEKKASDVENID